MTKIKKANGATDDLSKRFMDLVSLKKTPLSNTENTFPQFLALSWHLLRAAISRCNGGGDGSSSIAVYQFLPTACISTDQQLATQVADARHNFSASQSLHPSI
jgi:hypothetical protein